MKMFMLTKVGLLNKVSILNKGFFARGLANQANDSNIRKIVVIGAGLMGSGIVQVAAQANYQVIMVDQDQSALTRGEGIISGSLARVAKKKFQTEQEQSNFVNQVKNNYKTSTDLLGSVEGSDMVVEAIVENLKVKQQLFKSLDQAAGKNTIFCSNTSSLPLTNIAELTSRKNRFAGLHFFNPVPQMKLVEVITLNETDKDVRDQLTQFCKNIGKAPVLCKDTPGFIVNRLLVPYMMEAVRLYERGDATIEDIDTGMKLGAGYPMGPFELMDYVGLDTLKFITDQWYETNPHLKGESLIKPNKIINDLVSQGHLGRKSGRGFYDYSKK